MKERLDRRNLGTEGFVVSNDSRKINLAFWWEYDTI